MLNLLAFLTNTKSRNKSRHSIMTIYNKSSFESYYSLVFTEDNIDNLKKGWYEVTLGQVKSVNGSAAKVLVKVAEILGLSDDQPVLKYLLDNDLTVKKVYSVAYMAAKNEETEEKELVLSLGGIPHSMDTFVNSLLNQGFVFNADIVDTKQNEQVQQHPCFSFFKPKTNKQGQMLMPLSSDIISFEIVASIKSDEDEQKAVDQQLINALHAIRAEEMGFEELLEADLIQTIGSGVQFDMFAKLKELPFGGYDCTPVEHKPAKVVKKDNISHNIGEQYRFIATSLEDGTKYCVDVSVSHQIGRAAKSDEVYQKENWFLGVHGHYQKKIGGNDVTCVECIVDFRINIGKALLKRAFGNKVSATENVKSAEVQVPQLNEVKDLRELPATGYTIPLESDRPVEPITVPAQTVNNHVTAVVNNDIPF